MLKVKNQKVVGEIAQMTYRANKKRMLLTVFAISLTIFLIAVVIAVGVSYWNTVSERRIRMQGMDYDIELSEPREEQVEKIRAMDGVKYAGIAVKCAILEQYRDVRLDKTRLYYLDETCWEKQTVCALESCEGAYPEKENEIMLSRNALDAMGISSPQIGMELPVLYYTLNENSGEALLEKEFVLCGWYRDYSGEQRGYISEVFWKETGVKQTDFTQGSLKITLENPLYSEKDITAIQNAAGMEHNQYIDADTGAILNFCKLMAGLTAMLFMIFASGYLVIYTPMYLSVAKDIRYYGQLKTVGMTSVQLKRMIYRQAVQNAAAGIPLGLAAAYAVGRILIPQLVGLLNPVYDTDGAGAVSTGVYPVAAGFAFFTNLASSRKPAKMAGDCSPVEAVRYTEGGRARHNRREGSGAWYNRREGSGARHNRRAGSGVYAMAVHNIFRDRKQAVVIFLSFLIAVSMFFVIHVVIRENDARHILNEVCTCDIEFKNETTLDDDRQQLITEDKIAELEQLGGVAGVRRVASTGIVIPYQEEVYETYFQALYQSRYSPGNYEEDMELYNKDPENPYFTPRMISVDENGFALLNGRLGGILDQEAFEAGKIAVAVKFLSAVDGDAGLVGKSVRFYLPDGKNPQQEHCIEIAAAAEGSCNPAFFAGGLPPDLIVSETYAEKIMGELFTELIDVEYRDAFSEAAEQEVKAVFAGEKQISHESKLERYAEMKNSEIQVKVLGGSLGGIIALLAVLNYLNLMAANVQNRAREFAILESIGMTSGQIRKMLRAEGAGYAAVSIALSLAAGVPASCAVFDAMNVYGISYSIPWGRNLVLFAAVTALCMLVPVRIYQKTQKGSIIERLSR